MERETLETVNCAMVALFGIGITVWRHRFAHVSKYWAKVITGRDYSYAGYVVMAAICGPIMAVSSLVYMVFLLARN